ncbi:hypothetical protein ACONSV_005159 [Escherichia coli]
MNNGVFSKSEELAALLIAGGLPKKEVHDFVNFVYEPSHEKAIDEVMAFRSEPLRDERRAGRP